MKARILACAMSVWCVGTAVEAGEKPWIEVRSPHFRVLTDSSANDGRRVASEFEQMRSVFASRYPSFRLETGAPLTIFAARDEDTAKSLAPSLWKRKGAKPAGHFQQGWEKKYALVRLDAWGTGAHEVVFHEYTHSLLHANTHWMPTWMDEGIAEFYAYTRFEDKKILLGVATERYRVLQSQPPIPIETLISVTPSSPYYHDEDKVQVFYAEAWALIHFMTFGPNMEGGKKLNEFFVKLQQGGDQKKSFVEVFGSFAAMDKALDEYVRQFQLTAGVVKKPELTSEKDYSSRTLTMAETQAEIGGYHLWTHDLNNARAYVEDAIKNDPKLGLAHEEKGFVDFAEGKDAESLEEFTQAFADDNRLYLSLLGKTMLSPVATSENAADEEAFKKDLNAVIAINAQYAPAYVQLARLAVRQNDLNTAFRQSRKAEELEPYRAGYHLQTGQIMLRMGHGAEAAKFAKYVAERWSGPDHNEAVELWNQVPEAQRPASDALTETAPKDAQRMEGKMKAMKCGSSEDWVLMLEHDGQTYTFHRKGGFAWGFSDTLWYGEDHINMCHHLEGLRTIVYYRPNAVGGADGDVAEFEIRDDLAGAAAAPAPVKASAVAGAPGN